MTEYLSEEAFKNATDFIQSSARYLERSIYNYRFQDKDCNNVFAALKDYQNSDGGFGFGLGPDLRAPISTPIATTHAFQKLEEFDKAEIDSDLVENGITYFEDTFNSTHNRWFAVSKEVNDYPHPPWWHYDEEKEGMMVDEPWGNPTAEIIGYLHKYERFLNEIDPGRLVEEALNRLSSKSEFDSEHETYCYIRLYRALPSDKAKEMRGPLSATVQSLVRKNTEEWTDYVPKPLDFVKSPEGYQFGMSDELIKVNLDFLVETLEDQGVLRPSWEWGQYEDAWERAEQEWIGVLTLEALTLLKRFDRIRS